MAGKWAARKGLIFVVAEKWAFAKTGIPQKQPGAKMGFVRRTDFSGLKNGPKTGLKNEAGARGK